MDCFLVGFYAEEILFLARASSLLSFYDFESNLYTWLAHVHEFLWWPLLPSMIFHHYLLRLSRLHSMIALSDSMPIIFMRIYANVQSLTCIFAFYDPYMSVFFDLYCCLLWPVYSMKLSYTTFYNLHRCLSMTPAWHCDFYGSIRFKSSKILWHATESVHVFLRYLG